MLKYAIRKVLYFPLTLLASLAVAFFLVRLLPGEPFRVSEKTTTQYIVRQHEIHGLDVSLPLQFWNFLTRLIRLDFGNSYFQPRLSVVSLVWEHFTISLILILIAFILMVLIGLSLGIFTANRQNTWVDYTLNNLAVFFSSFPSFVLAALCFALSRWLTATFMLYEAPIGGWGNPAKNIPPTFLQIFFPAFILAIRPAAMVMRITYAQIIEDKNRDYVRIAQAKGLAPGTIMRRHIFRNSLIPVTSTIGNLFGFLLIGVAEVEIVFRVPGLGSYFVSSILALDYPVVIGATCFYTLLITSVNLVIDLLYGVLDPRITYTKPG